MAIHRTDPAPDTPMTDAEATVTAELSPSATAPNRRRSGRGRGTPSPRVGLLPAGLALMLLVAVVTGGLGGGSTAMDLAADGGPLNGPAAQSELATLRSEVVEYRSIRSVAADRLTERPATYPYAAADAEPYPFRVIEAVDVSTASTRRQGLAIEINRFPVERERLLATLDATILGLAEGTKAVTVRVHYDRREHSPAAFGVWVWAPGGRWDRAADGDPTTWDGYRWSAEFEPGKIERPERCQPLSEDELAVMGAFWPRVWSTNEPDADIRRDVADSLGVTIERFAEIEAGNLAWNDC